MVVKTGGVSSFYFPPLYANSTSYTTLRKEPEKNPSETLERRVILLYLFGLGFDSIFRPEELSDKHSDSSC